VIVVITGADGCRGEPLTRILFTGGCVLTLGAKTSNLATGDVLVDGDTIAEIGPQLRARDAETVDATGTIVMPGFVDAHRHVWRSLFRNLGTTALPGSPLEPDDVYAATLIGLLGAAEAGITSVVDRQMPGSSAAATEAAVRAHADAGLRSVVVLDDGRTAAPDGAGPLTSFAQGVVLAGDAAPAIDAARAADRRVHLHPAAGAAAPGTVAALGAAGHLGEDVTVEHGAGLDDADLAAIASAGAALTLAPSSEMASGPGSPPIQELVDRGVRPGLGIDDERVAPGDMFAQMRATISLQHATVFDRKLAGKAGLPKLMSTRDVIRFGTVEAARAAGLRGVAGSLEPGRQADIVVLRADTPNIFPVNDPIGAVVWGMDTSNVDHVLVAGRFVVRGGALLADAGAAGELARAAHGRVLTASGPGGSAA
jgi:cytosine/adenosine deaminase-related metal-dependent hydrolase